MEFCNFAGRIKSLVNLIRFRNPQQSTKRSLISLFLRKNGKKNSPKN